jgi:hypothetical protein
MLNKVLLSAAITLGAALTVAEPASADPSSFGTLGCSCSTQPGDVPQGGPTVNDQIIQGIQRGLSSLHGDPPIDIDPSSATQKPARTQMP